MQSECFPYCTLKDAGTNETVHNTSFRKNWNLVSCRSEKLAHSILWNICNKAKQKVLGGNMIEEATTDHLQQVSLTSPLPR